MQRKGVIMNSNEVAKNVIRGYLADMRNIQAKNKRWQFQLFQQESYSIWAANELLNELRKNKTDPPLVVMEEFRDRMDAYSCKNKETSFIFSVAKDTTEVLIDILLK